MQWTCRGLPVRSGTLYRACRQVDWLDGKPAGFDHIGGFMAKKLTAEEWGDYLALYEQVSQRLAKQDWFAPDWQTHYDYLNKENPSGVWFQLVRRNWFDAAIHLETALRNSNLESGTFALALHIETSKDKHGISRNDFSKRFLEQVGDRIESWNGYTIKPNYAMEPFKTELSFTRDTLAAVLTQELERLQTLGDIIDETIAAVRK
jgi:hypothetical protein